jgi:hypothetical protein
MASGKMRRTKRILPANNWLTVAEKAGNWQFCGNAVLDRTGAATAKARKKRTKRRKTFVL